MNSTHINPDDLALFALQLLTPEEMDAMRSHLTPCGDCRQELARFQGDLAVLALTADVLAPVAASRDRLLQQIAREPRQSSIPTRVGAVATSLPAGREAFAAAGRAETQTGPGLLPQEPSARPNLVLRTLPWVGWAVAAGLAVSVSQMSHERDLLRDDVAGVNHQIAMLTEQTSAARRLLETLNNPSAQRVTLTLAKQRPVPQGKATYDADHAALVFVANNLEPLEPQKTYQLWIIPANGEAPVSAGIFHPDQQGNASVLLPKLPTGVAAKAFGVTIENDGGSPTPTMPIILAGAAGV